MATGDKRGYAPSMFNVQLDGTDAGYFSSAEGGGAESEVVTSKIGADRFAKKTIGGVKYGDVSLSCSAAMSKNFLDWIGASMAHKYARKNGAIIACDFNYKEVSRMNFFNALVTEIGLPALDAKSKDSAKFTCKFAPEYTRVENKPGGAPKAVIKRESHLWSPANFRIEAEGLTDACKRVSKVEAITIKQKVTENAIGDMRDYEKEPTSMEVPNLVVTFLDSHADPVYQWHEDFVIKGNCGEDKEKNFTLTYLDQSRTKTLMTIELRRCGIFKLSADKLEAGGDNLRTVKGEFYVEEIAIVENKSWA